MEKTLNNSNPRMQACAELPHSQNAVTQQGLINLFLATAARCVFVRQIAICTTNTLAPKGD